MRGVLFDNFMVKLDPRAAHYGGSWIPGSGDVLQAHGQDMLKLFYEHTRAVPAPVVMDIGANTGSFSLLPAFNRAMTVFAFEPVPPVYDILCANIRVNALGGCVTAVNTALSDGVGEGDMLIPLNRAQSGLSFLDTRAPDMPCRTERVPITTLDQFCATQGLVRLEFIKIDVEGLEHKVLRGGEQTIRRYTPTILFEAVNTDHTIPIVEAWGYTCTDYHSDILATYKE